MIIYGDRPIDWAQVEGFDWDEGNAMKNAKHSVTDAEADEGRLLHVAFTLRAAGTRVRVISARPMHRSERKAYEAATQSTS